VTFRAKGRCYVEGVMIEAADQELVLSSAAAFRQRNNKNLEIVKGEIQAFELPQGLDLKSGKGRAEATRLEREFSADNLDEADPILSAPPVDVRLIKQ
jgi:hypothetical protein